MGRLLNMRHLHYALIPPAAKAQAVPTNHAVHAGPHARDTGEARGREVSIEGVAVCLEPTCDEGNEDGSVVPFRCRETP